MGFIEIAAVNSSEELSGIWSEFYDISKAVSGGRITALSQKITDGTRIFLGGGQSAVLISENKIADYITGPAAFVFHKAFECGKYTSGSGKQLNAAREKSSSEFGDFSENAECFIINASERVKIPFEFSEAEYYDKTCGFNITLQGSGYFGIGISDALACFVGSDFDSENFAQRDFLNISEESKNELAAAFENMLKSALSDMRELDIDYDKLIYRTDEIAARINTNPQNVGYLPNGIEITEVEFTSICPDEKSIMEIVNFRRKNNGQK